MPLAFWRGLFFAVPLAVLLWWILLWLLSS